MHVGWKWNCNVTVTVRREGMVVVQRSMHNVITNDGLSLARDAILGDRPLTITQVGLGAFGNAPDSSDTGLVGEEVRAEIIRREALSPNEALTTAYVAPGIANDFTINEIGWFGGNATSVINTGTLISRVLFNHDKNELESIQIDRFDSFVEG